MKRVIVVAFLAGAVLASAGAGWAVSQRIVRLQPGDHAKWAGVDCQATALSYGYLTCVSNWKYSVIYGAHEVTVFRGTKEVFHRSR